MKKQFYSLLIAIFVLCVLSPSLIAEKMNGDRLHNLTTTVQTPHLNWAKKLPNGKLKVLFVVSLSQARAVVEAAQRMDITLDAVTTSLRGNNLGITSDKNTFYGSLYNGTSDTAKAAELLKKLDRTYDVIVISGPDFSVVPTQCKLKILRQVKSGTGLIFFKVRDARKILRKILNKKAVIPECKTEIISLADNMANEKLPLTAYRFGKGQIFIANYSLYASPFSYLSPRWWSKHENAQVLLLRTLLAAAGRKAMVKITCPELAKNPKLTQAARRISLKIKTAESGVLEYRLRNDFNKIIKNGNLKFSGNQTLNCTLPKLPAGRYYLDLIAKIGKNTDNFGFYAFHVFSPIQAEIINPDDTVKGFGPIKATLKLNQPLLGGEAVLSLADSPYGRVWYRKKIKLGNSSKIPIAIKNYYMPTMAAFLRVDIIQKGETLCSADTTYFFPVYNQKLPTFSELVWDYNPGGIDRLRSIAEYDRMGNSGIIQRTDGRRPSVQNYMLLNMRLWIDHVVREVSLGRKKGKNGGFAVVPWKNNIPALKGEEKKFLQEKEYYLLDEPDSKRYDKLVVKASVRNKDLDRYPAAFYGIAHESSANYNDGFSAADNKAFRNMLKMEYGNIAKLNAEWNRNYASFAKVPHAKMTYAHSKKLYPEWLAHRRFVNKVVETRSRNIAAEIKKYDPYANVGMNSSWWRNPGYNIENILADKNINFMSLYSRVPEAEELRSLRPDMEMIVTWGWIMPNESYPEAPWYNLLAGTAKHTAWFISGASMGGCLLSADYRSFRTKIPVEMDKLRSGLAQLLITTPLKFDGLAIWENYNCNVANQLGDPRFIQTTDSSKPLIDFAYQNGINFDFIDWRGMAKKLAKYKVLFLCGASAISRYQKQQMLKYVKNGGIIIADLNPGVMNDSFGIVSGGVLPELFGRYPAKLLKPANSCLNVNTKLHGKLLKLVSEAPVTPGIAPFVIRKYGKGKAILLNFSLAAAKLNAKGDNFNNFMLDLVKACGITVTVKTSGLPSESIVRVREGDGFQLVGLMNRRLAFAGQDSDKSMKLTFPGKMYIYEPGKGFIAEGNSVNFKFAPPFKLFAGFPIKQKAPVIKLSSNTAVPGTPVKLDLSSFPTGRVLLLRMRDNAGKLVRLPSETAIHAVFEVKPKEKSRLIHFAYNMPKEDYELTLTDVVTGLTSKAVIKLK